MADSRAFQASKMPPLAPLAFVGEVDCRQFNVLEIGAGVGRHAIRYALEHPQHQVYAVEHSKERFAKFDRRMRAHERKELELVNLQAVHADGESFVAHHVPEASLNCVFLLYPNPYPKASQSNKRWHNMPFFDFLSSRMKQGGELHLATNESFYAEEAIEVLVQKPSWELRTKEELSLNSHPDFQPRTHFEKKYFLEGQSLFHASWEKT